MPSTKIRPNRRLQGVALGGRAGLSPNRNARLALLEAKQCAGVSLTETYVMWPIPLRARASVSGFYVSHPQKPLFRYRQDRARPGRGLRALQGLARRRSGTLARADPQLRSTGRGGVTNGYRPLPATVDLGQILH